MLVALVGRRWPGSSWVGEAPREISGGLEMVEMFSPIVVLCLSNACHILKN
jgi:hypothetical protein